MPRPIDDADVAALAAGRPLVLLLDIDGTLAPIAPTPADARVPATTRAAIARLTAAPGVVVALVSGRSAEDAHRMVGVDGVWAVGNHGAECRTPDGVVDVDGRVAAYRLALERAAAALGALGGSFDGVWVEDKTWSLSLHYRQAARAAVPAIVAAADDVAAAQGLRVRPGKEVREVRAPVDVDKGTAVVALLDRVGGCGPRATVAYLGDDATDEDAFCALRAAVPRALTVRVGSAGVDTTATRLMPDPDAVQRFLVAVADARTGRPG